MIVQKHNTNKIGFKVTTGFTITQHIKDEFLMKSFITYFGCGRVEYRENKMDFVVKNFQDNSEIILPFFIKHPILGVKSRDYQD